MDSRNYLLNVHGWGWGMTHAVETRTMFTRLDFFDRVLIGISGLTLALCFLLLRYRLVEESALCVMMLPDLLDLGTRPLEHALLRAGAVPARCRGRSFRPFEAG